MNKYDRLDEITKLVNKRGSVRTNEIVEDLNVSDMTVRRDLAELEEKVFSLKYMVVLVVIQLSNIKKCLIKKTYTFYWRKRFIAKNAVDLIEDGDTIFLGPGTTVQKLAEEINHYSLTIITNCLPVFNILIKTNVTFQSLFIRWGNAWFNWSICRWDDKSVIKSTKI